MRLMHGLRMIILKLEILKSHKTRTQSLLEVQETIKQIFHKLKSLHNLSLYQSHKIIINMLMYL
jgi:hypothetical protein